MCTAPSCWPNAGIQKPRTCWYAVYAPFVACRFLCHSNLSRVGQKKILCSMSHVHWTRRDTPDCVHDFSIAALNLGRFSVQSRHYESHVLAVLVGPDDLDLIVPPCRISQAAFVVPTCCLHFVPTRVLMDLGHLPISYDCDHPVCMGGHPEVSSSSLERSRAVGLVAPRVWCRPCAPSASEPSR